MAILASLSLEIALVSANVGHTDARLSAVAVVGLLLSAFAVWLLRKQGHKA